jgi:hypothetical protein
VASPPVIDGNALSRDDTRTLTTRGAGGGVQSSDARHMLGRAWPIFEAQPNTILMSHSSA